MPTHPSLKCNIKQPQHRHNIHKLIVYTFNNTQYSKVEGKEFTRLALIEEGIERKKN